MGSSALRSVAYGRAPKFRAVDILSRLEIEQVADRRVNEVSGGQAQRAAVTRALIHEPAVVFADEPTGSLDTLAGELVLEALVGASRERETAVVLVTHEPRVAAYADREVMLRDGLVVGTALVAPCASWNWLGDWPGLVGASGPSPSWPATPSEPHPWIRHGHAIRM